MKQDLLCVVGSPHMCTQIVSPVIACLTFIITLVIMKGPNKQIKPQKKSPN